MRAIALVLAAAAVLASFSACSAASKETAAPPADGGSPDSNAGDGGNEGGGPSTSGPVRYACPIDKPQKVYGFALNAKQRIDGEETWTPDNVYLVFGPLHIDKKLTIQAGTVVCFDYGPPGADGSSLPPPGEMRIDAGGAIDAQGTADKHVVLTAQSDGKGAEQLYWKGITATSGWTAFKMTHTDLYNGGLSAGGAPLEVLSDNGLAPPVDWQNVTVYSSQRIGLKVLNAKGFTPETHLVFKNFADEYVAKYASDANFKDYYDHGYPVLRVTPDGASTVTSKTFEIGDAAGIPPATRYVQLDHAEGALVQKDYQLHKLPGLAWRTLQNELLIAKVTIDPGTTIAVANGGTWFIGDKGGCSSKGSLVAVGTPAEPITFTNDIPWQGQAEKAPQKSPGISINPCGFGAETKFDYVVFDGLGTLSASTTNCKGTSPGWAGELNFIFSSDGQTREGPPITHATFKNSAGFAIFKVDGSRITTDYANAALENTFTGFTDPAKPAIPTCN